MPTRSPRTAVSATAPEPVVVLAALDVVGSGTLVGASAGTREPVHGKGPVDAVDSSRISPAFPAVVFFALFVPPELTTKRPITMASTVAPASTAAMSLRR